jgi:hypothetical protein
MLLRPRQLIGPTLVALAVVVLAAAPVAAKHPIADLSPGAFMADVSGAAVAKDGVLSMKVKYTCSPYEAPFDGSDIVIASVSSGASGFDGIAAVVCDGSSQQVTLSLTAFNGGFEGPTSVVLAHQGMTADGSSGTVGVFAEVPGRVVMAGHE